ncbi:MAG TPA: ABC transporter permease [Actinomycetota bacterium]|nr:ABC transporter permease [Actinomycetota bacterium]
MGRYIVRRVLFLILVLIVVSFVTFLIFVKLPASDPAHRAIGRTATPETIRAIRKTLGLDKPWYVQYWKFAKGIIPWPGLFLGDVKQHGVYFSWNTYTSVREDIFKRLPVTMMLGMGAAVVWMLVGIPIGILSAIRRRSLADRSAMIFAILGVSLPIFWLAYVFLYIFWFRLGWLPGSGLPRGLSVIQAALTGHFILPWIVLSLAFMAFYARMTRGNLIETMSEDFIRTARAKGLSERRVIFRHGLRSALTPVVTMFGMDLGVLLGGAVITETVFDLDGIGRYLIQALQANDFPAVMGVVMFASFFIVVANLVVDVAYAFLDPRVRYT